MKNRTLGSVFIVAGTTIGAGMLAMPLAAAGVGFSVTLILLIGLWALMCYTALLLLEVYQHVPADTGLGTLAKRYLGRYGQWLTGFSMMFLMYALTAAYISGAGELLASSISDWTGISMSATAGVLLFTFVAGGVVCVGTSLVDLFNRFLFSAKIIFGGDAGIAATACSQSESFNPAVATGTGTVCNPGDFYVVWFSR